MRTPTSPVTLFICGLLTDAYPIIAFNFAEEGLDSLLDWVEGWTLQSGSDALVSKELLLDDDNWSDPASSLDGALRLDLLDSSF